MIISASRRTDIPALYSAWLWNRIEAGSCQVPNPFNPRQISVVSLVPADVDAIVFWTRHARPLLPLLPRLRERGYRFYFHYTITGYGGPVEPRTPPLEVALATFRALAATLPLGAVIWRYDPILLGTAFPPERHMERFAAIAARLEGSTDRVITSLVHPYRKTERRLSRLYALGREIAREPALDPRTPALLARLAVLARRHGMQLEACAQPHDYSALGVAASRCIDDRLLARLFGGTWPSRKDPGQRPECGCIPSKDIGVADSCTFGCAYCYATRDDGLARRRRRQHDRLSPVLIGAGRASCAADLDGLSEPDVRAPERRSLASGGALESARGR